MKRLALTVNIEVRLAFAAHQLRSMVQGFDPVPYKRFQAVALLYGKW